MSCPTREMLSAFFDGEIELPWSERIRRHLDECAHCQAEITKLETLRQLLHSDEEPDFKESLERTRFHLETTARPKLARKSPFWRNKISLPLPAAAAILFVALAMGGMLIFLSTRPNFPFMSITREPSGVTEVQVAAPIEDLEQLLKSLDRQSVNQEILINLPEDTQFIIVGEPEMVRETEHSRRSRW